MGQEIHKTEFDERDFAEFSRRLEEETAILKRWFKDKAFERDISSCGFELEAWLVDKDKNPAPHCIPFLENLQNPQAVPELSLFNFEYNSSPHAVETNLLSKCHQELNSFWDNAYQAAAKVNAEPLTIGILPTLNQNELVIKNLHPNKRYKALDEQLRRMRDGADVSLSVEGHDTLNVQHQNLLIETVSTSLQIHLQLNASKAVRYYNTGFIIAAPMVAVAANSPYLFGKTLWDETRIPVFEQSVEVLAKHNPSKDALQRVTFGTGYVQDSIFELYEENLKYAVLLPELLDTPADCLSHLRMHNGTVWRWNRPIIDMNKNGVPHIRLEHRVAAAGTSSVDLIANIALFLGLMRYYAYCKVAPQAILSFAEAKDNFYKASKDGLSAKVTWRGEHNILLKDLLLQELLPKAKQGLLKLGLDSKDIAFYLENVIQSRVESGTTGAVWQRNFLQNSPKNFVALLQKYMQMQKKDIPVHEWGV